MIGAPAVRALARLRGCSAGAAGPGAMAGTLTTPRSSHERFRRARRECLLAIDAAQAALEEARLGPRGVAGDRTGLVYVTAAAYAASNRDFIVGTGGGIHFAYTAPAVVPAEVAIEFGVTGPYAGFIGGAPATLEALWQAASWLAAGECDRAMVLAVEVFEECGDLFRRTRRLLGTPLAEGAACLLLDPGSGEDTLAWSAPAPRRGLARRPLPEGFTLGPFETLDAWRRDPGDGACILDGDWRGRPARLVWRRAARRQVE